MRFIGITGGVGAGKSEILGYLAKKPDTRVMLADEIAHELMSPGTECYDRICETFGAEDIFLPLQMPGTKVGQLLPEIQKEVGFDLEVVLCGSHDTASAVMAVPQTEGDGIYISSGTWSLMGIESLKPVITEDAAAANFTNEGG